MSKRTVFFATLAVTLAMVTPAYASKDVETNAEAEKGQTTGKHNFDQWQTIKRLQVKR